MRMVTIALAASMLLMGVTAYAHEVPGPEDDDRTIKTELESYTNNLTVEDDVRVQPGWWGDHGVTLNVTDDNETETSVNDKPEWLWVIRSESNVDVTVTTHGALVGAVDVFKYRFPAGGGQHTPDCPQQLVEEQYPESLDAPGFLTRVARETVGYHQRAGSSGELPSQSAEDDHLTSQMDLTLDMSRTNHGYLLAFYPQAATGSDEVEAETGDSSMWWNLEPQGGTMAVQDNLENDQSDLPVEINEWAGSAGTAIDCANRLIVPPEVPEDGAAVPDLPGATADADDLMNAALPE